MSKAEASDQLPQLDPDSDHPGWSSLTFTTTYFKNYMQFSKYLTFSTWHTLNTPEPFSNCFLWSSASRQETT